MCLCVSVLLPAHIWSSIAQAHPQAAAATMGGLECACDRVEARAHQLEASVQGLEERNRHLEVRCSGS